MKCIFIILACLAFTSRVEYKKNHEPNTASFEKEVEEYSIKCIQMQRKCMHN